MNPLTDPQLEAARLGVEKSLAIHAANQATLFTFEGKPIYPPDKQASEAARLLVGVEASVDRAVTTADKVTAEVESQRLAPHADPTSALSAGDLADANLRAVWVKEDCESLPLDDLVERLRAVHAAGVKSSTWLHWRYAKVRLDREFAKSSQDPALSAYAAVCRELGITGDKSGLSDEAQKRQEAAAQLKRWATWELGKARDPQKDAADKAKFAQQVRSMF